jgi:hypothetical protein
MAVEVEDGASQTPGVWGMFPVGKSGTADVINFRPHVKWENAFRKEILVMAKNSKSSRPSGRAWKNERASVNNKDKSRSKSNKYRPASDASKRPTAGTSERYWRAGYTRKDGTKVKGHYVNKSTS